MRKRLLMVGRSRYSLPLSPSLEQKFAALSQEATEREAIFFSTEPGDQAESAGRWIGGRMRIPLSIVDAPFRDLSDPMLAEVRRHTRQRGTVVTVVLPELVVAHWWEHLLHNQTSLFFKRLLLFEPDVVVTSVPTHVRHLENRRAPGAATGRRSRQSR